MKAIKYLTVLFCLMAILFSCKPKAQQKHTLDPTSKEYFDVKNGSKYIFSEVGDSNVSIEYITSNYVNAQSNPDIENNEILTYDLNAVGQPKISLRVESGGTQYKDRIALITTRNDSNFIGPIIYNLGGNFTTLPGSYDTIERLPTYRISDKVFENVVRIVIFYPVLYREVYFAKNIGLIAKREKNGKLYYARKYFINK